MEAFSNEKGVSINEKGVPIRWISREIGECGTLDCLTVCELRCVGMAWIVPISPRLLGRSVTAAASRSEGHAKPDEARRS